MTNNVGTGMDSTSEPMVFARQSSGMVRGLSWVDVLIMSVAAPAGSGILYYSVNTQSSYPGGNIALAFVIGLIVFLPVSFVVSMLATAMPRSGSLYVAVSRLMDSSVGFIGAYLYFIGQAMIAGVLGNIITTVVGGIFTTSGDAYSMAFLRSAGLAMQTTTAKIIGGILWVALFWAVGLGGMKVFRRVQQVFFYLPLMATAMTVGFFLVRSPVRAIDAFNATWGAGAFEKILYAAQANGWSAPVFSLSSTFGLLLVVMWAYNGIDMGTYAGSEVQSPQRSFVKGVILGWLIVGLLYIVLAFAVYRPFGPFIGAYDYLSSKKPEVLQQIMPLVKPSVPFYIISVAGNKFIGILVSLTIVLWFVNCIPPIFMSTSRILFALSMDRLVPTSLSGVSERAAPTWATHITALVAVLGVIFQTYDVQLVLGTLLFCTFFIFWMYGFAAMVLPYRKPDIYLQLPCNYTIAGVPLLSVAGLLTFGIGWFFVFFAARQISLPVAFFLAVILLLGALLYYTQVSRNHREGVRIGSLMEMLPPE